MIAPTGMKAAMDTNNTWVPLPLFEADRGGWTIIKTIPSYTGLSRFYAECDEQASGWIVTPKHIPSPYRSGPDVAVNKYKGKNVIVREVSHKRYEVIEVPAGERIYKTDQEATDAFIAQQKADREANS